MEKIEVISQGFKVNGGIVILDKDQARRRKSSIKEIGKGKYEVIKPINFKVGEKLEVDSIEGYNKKSISLIKRQGTDKSIKEEQVVAKAEVKTKAKKAKAAKAAKAKAEKTEK